MPSVAIAIAIAIFRLAAWPPQVDPMRGDAFSARLPAYSYCSLLVALISPVPACVPACLPTPHGLVFPARAHRD